MHHASLDRKVRLDTEARFGDAGVGICFATSTLELGVDIGDIDIVILAGPPYSVGSFLQRIGRGNRRTNTTTVLGFYRSLRERHLFDVLLECAESGVQDEGVYAFRPSVVIQQILSYLKQNPAGALSERHLRVLLDAPVALEPLLSAKEEEALIEHLIETKILRRDGRRGELLQGETAGGFYERHEVNANIESAGRSVTVVDSLTGRAVGEIQERDLRPEDSFALGGSRLDVVRQEGRTIVVDTAKAGGAMRRLRYRSRGRVLPFDLARRLGERVGLRAGELPAFQLEQTWLILHALGDVYGRILSLLLRRETGWKSGAGGLFLTARERPPLGYVLGPDEAGVRELAEDSYQAFEPPLGLGKFQKLLPDELRRRAVARACLITRFCEKAYGLRLSEVNDVRVRDRFCELL